MAKWSRQQDDVLWEHGNEGAERCADIIRRRFGVSRTAEAVRRHAYRIGASIIEYGICVGCGGKARRVDDEGLCPACHQRMLAERTRMRNARVIRELDGQEASFAEARREYDRERKRASRAKSRA